MKSVTLLTGLIFLLSGCDHDPWPEDKSEYIGIWQGDNILLEIMVDGNVSYAEIYENFNETIDSPIQEFTEEGFTIGYLFFTKEFKVSRAPVKIDDTWIMVVNGVELRKHSN